MPHTCGQCSLVFNQKCQLSMCQYDIHSLAYYTNTNMVMATTTRVNDDKVQCPIMECDLLLVTQHIFLRHLKRVHQLLAPVASTTVTTPAPAPPPTSVLTTVVPTSPDVMQYVEVGHNDTLIEPSALLQAGMS